jgi:protein-S-isoprenylcysteine O-methyltransferase Ste14
MTATQAVWNVVKTTGFLVVFWSVFLFAVPIGISILEIEIGIQRFPPQRLLAAVTLLLFTLLTLWSAMTLAVVGEGTPMSFDPPRQLVTTGPYAYVRHPFVIGAIGQVVALGIALGSIPVIVYAAAALTFWYYGIRRREERGLEARFGEAVRDYFRRVRGFRPF